MAEDSLYDKHKKYHDLAETIRDIQKEEKISPHVLHAQKSADTVFDKYQKEGIVDFSKIKEEDLEKDFGAIWDDFAENVAKTYLKMSDEEIENFKSKKTEGGGSVWEHMMGRYLGQTRQSYVDNLKQRGTVNAKERHEALAHPLADKHIQYKVGEVLDENLRSLDDIVGIHEYVKMVKDHNPESTKKVSARPYKSLDEAKGGLAQAAAVAPGNYHPDNKETYY